MLRYIFLPRLNTLKVLSDRFKFRNIWAGPAFQTFLKFPLQNVAMISGEGVVRSVLQQQCNCKRFNCNLPYRCCINHTFFFYLNEWVEEPYPYRGNVMSNVSSLIWFSAFRTDFRNLPNRTLVSSWQQLETTAFMIPGNIPSTVSPGIPLFFVW